MAVSFLLHIAVIVLLLLLSPSPVNIVNPRRAPKPRTRILLSPIPSPSQGGGGSRSITPPSRGRLPRVAQRQFTPAMVVPVALNPKLAMEPAIVMTAIEPQPSSNLPLGLPDGVPGAPSGGPGSLGGIGDGTGGGAGNRSGQGMDGIAAEPLRAGMQPPVVIYKIEPEYSEQARKARIQGTIVIEGVIDEKGNTHALRVRDGLGLGLDEQAIEAVKKWRFRPATRGGKPLAIIGTFYLTFRLL